ncbi:glycosyl hydrolase family 18 protein [Sinomicrobium sp. M5D2P17]
MKLIKNVISLTFMLCILFTGCEKQENELPDKTALEAPLSEETMVLDTDFKVIGYVPSWSGSVNAIQFDKLTHVNYAFALPTPSGGLQPIENTSKLQSLVSAAHANNVAVLLAIGGWNNGDHSAFDQLCSAAATRTNFVNTLVSTVNQYGLDGIDIDYEYPPNGAGATNFTLMMQELGTAMHNMGKLLTAAVVSENGSSIQSGVFEAVDFLNLMAYDGGGSNHSTYNLAVNSLNYWKGRGLPAGKAILGVPFYGRSASEYVVYHEILARGGGAYSDYYGNIGYNGIPTIKSKTNLAFDQGGGIMIWELAGDATGSNSLLTAIHEVVEERANGNPNPPIEAPVGQMITLRGSNGKYVSSENGETGMMCDRDAAEGWEVFTVVGTADGKIALQGSNGMYVSSENGEGPMMCNRPAIDGWETFEWLLQPDGTVALRGFNGMYISSENGEGPMMCDRPAIEGWEKFTVTIVSSATTAGTAVQMTTPAIP